MYIHTRMHACGCKHTPESWTHICMPTHAFACTCGLCRSAYCMHAHHAPLAHHAIVLHGWSLPVYDTVSYWQLFWALFSFIFLRLARKSQKTSLCGLVAVSLEVLSYPNLHLLLLFGSRTLGVSLSRPLPVAQTAGPFVTHVCSHWQRGFLR